MQRHCSAHAAGSAADLAGTSAPEPPAKKQKSLKNGQLNGVKKEKKDQKPVMKAECVPGPGADYVSAYEASIQKNVQERMEMLKTLKIDAIKEEARASMSEGRRNTKSFKKFKQVGLTPSRRSRRINTAGVPRPPPPPPELRKLGTETVTSASTGYSEPEDTVRHMADISRELAQQEPPSETPSYREALAGLAMTKDTGTMVTPQAVNSIAFCPLRQKHVLATGHSKGVLGLWDVCRGEDGVHMLSAHTGHIVGLSFSPTDGHKCYTSSYDGISRCLDLQRQQFDEVYVAPAPEPGLHLYLNHHTHAGEHCLLLGQSDGRLVRRDPRSQEVSTQQLSGRGGLRFLSVHPSREHCLAAAERPDTVSLWDLRQVKGPRSALQRVVLPRPCGQAAISRHSGDYLLVPDCDGTIRLYDGITQGQMNITKTFRQSHNARCVLMTFRPSWLPGSDDLFVVGPVNQPRRMEVFDRSSGSVHHLLMSQEMQAVVPLIVCHPGEPAIAGGTQAGKVYLYR